MKLFNHIYTASLSAETNNKLKRGEIHFDKPVCAITVIINPIHTGSAKALRQKNSLVINNQGWIKRDDLTYAHYFYNNEQTQNVLSKLLKDEEIC